MSKAIKTVVRIALPVIGGMVGGPLGAAVGGAIGGGMGGGGIKGAILGGITGGMGAAIGGAASGLGAGAQNLASQGSLLSIAPASAARTAMSTVGRAFLPSTGASSIPGSIGATLKGFASPSSLMNIGNQLMGMEGAETAEEAARKQTEALERGIATNTAANRPYTELGSNAAGQIQEIQADPGKYVQENPFYKSLADDAQRRLLANQAAKGKVGSGGTAAALQEQLLSLGNGLVQQQVGTLQNQVNTGANAAANVGAGNANMQVQQGNAQAAGQVGSFNATNSAYQNQINTMLALQGLQKAPIYAAPLNV